MLVADRSGNAIQIFAPNKFDSITLTGGEAYDFVINSYNKPDMMSYECSENIQVSMDGLHFGLPKDNNLFGIHKDINTISFTSENDTTLYLAWQL